MPRRKRDRTRPRSVWVYRGLERDAAGVTVGDQETYASTVFSIPSASGFQAFCLYDSDNFVAAIAGASGAGRIINATARPKGEKPRITAVAGQVFVEPSAWAVGNLIQMGFRIGVLEQDPLDGAFIGIPGYSMWGAVVADQAAQHSAGIHNLWETRIKRAFDNSITNPVFTFNIFAKFRRGITLSPRHGLSFGLETPAGSVATRVQLWLRSLVSDDG